MIDELALLAILALVAVAGWILAERDNRRLERERDEAWGELAKAFAADEDEQPRSTLTLIDGGRAS